MLRGNLFVFAYLFLFGAQVAAAEDARLVEIFCDEALLSTAWPAVVTRMEARERRGEKERSVGAHLSQCIAEHFAEFEMGEFILGGRDLLREETPAPAAASARIVQAAEVEVPFFGSVVLPLEEPATDAGPDTDERAESYERLWSEFLSRIQQRFPSPRVSAGLLAH